MTLYESAKGAVMPWNSIDAATAFETLPQQEIDICLTCPHHDGACDYCDGDGNPKKSGRPRAEIDTELLRKMLMLKKCNSEMCAALGVSERTLQRKKKNL